MKKRDEKLSSLYSQMGYSGKGEYMKTEEGKRKTMLHYYTSTPDDLMDYEGESEYKTEFNLKRSDIDIIVKVITESAAYQRTSQKSMMATRSAAIIPPEKESDFKNDLKFKDSEALVQTRQTHMREVAEISKIIADALGLNADLAYLTGLLHDIGHTWNGHSGERILSSIAKYNDCGYIVHNAMGAYIIEREHIIEDALEELKQFNPKIKEAEVRRFMQYVIDGVVSHNGEGVVGKIIPENKTTEKMIEEIRRCFTEKSFDKKIMPATLEGAIIRYADIIAYTRSDVLDGFRLRNAEGNKILEDFDDEYLAIIGTVLARKNNYSKILDLENKFLLELYGLSDSISKLEEKAAKSLLTPDERVELERLRKEKEMIEAKYEEFTRVKVEYAREHIAKIKNKSTVKTQITRMMQNVFIADLIENSKGKGYITMSPLIRRVFFMLRDLNVNRIVPYTRREFELNELPLATKRLVDDFANVLVRTGIVYKALPEEEKQRLGIVEGTERQLEEQRKLEIGQGLHYERKICHYYNKLSPEKMREIYENCLTAIEDISMHDLQIILGEEQLEGDLSELYKDKKLMHIKDIITSMGKSIESVTEADKRAIISRLVQEKRDNIVPTVASKLAIEYIGGMTDNTIISVLLDKNLISRADVIKGYARTDVSGRDDALAKLQKAFAANGKMILPDEENETISL